MEAMVLNGARRRREDERFKEAFVTVMFALAALQRKATCALSACQVDQGYGVAWLPALAGHRVVSRNWQKRAPGCARTGALGDRYDQSAFEIARAMPARENSAGRLPSAVAC